MIQNFPFSAPWFTTLLLLWSLPWKGYSLWTAARRQDKWWFIALLIINTVGILEIFYIFAIAKKKLPLAKKPTKKE